MKDELNFYDITNEPIDHIDPDTLGGDFEIPEDISEYVKEYEKNFKLALASSGVDIGGGLTIVDNLTTRNYSNRNNSNTYIVIHYTAGSVDNGRAAKDNTIYFKTEYREASAHYFVDMNPVIYRCVPDNLVAWHCGTTGTYYHPYCRNSNSIGIEICSYKENGVYKFKEQTVQNAIILTRYLAKKYNIPRSNIIMHWHVTHKICAAPFMTTGKPDIRWEKFLDSVFDTNEFTIDITPLNKVGRVYNLNNDVLNYRSGPSTNYSIIGSFKSGDILNITGQNGDWYNINYKGFVNSNYVKIENSWYDAAKEVLLEEKIITDTKQWSFYNDHMTKALAIQILSNTIGYNTNKQYKNNTHWASKALNNLINNNIIKDPSQWENSLDDNITNSLYLALMCNVVGGVLTKYKNRNIDHWARNCLDTLCDKEVIEDPKYWNNFEDILTKGNALSLMYKVWNKCIK